MPVKPPLLWAALRLHRILSQRRTSADGMPSFDTLLDEQRAVERCWRMCSKAVARGWTHAAQDQRQRLLSHVAAVHSASRESRAPRITQAPTVAELLAELTQLQEEFGELKVQRREKLLVVITDDITLEEVALGPFAIQLDLARLARRQDASAFVIVAKEPHPASSDSSCTHPHVHDQSLCAGDATVPIAHALAEGRMGDAFLLVDRVLHTYNGSSAYVALGDWNGSDCAECGHSTSSDSLYYCDQCHHDVCDDCSRTCDRCSASTCVNCSITTDDEERLCPRCHTLYEKQQAEEEPDETPNGEDPELDPVDAEPQPSQPPMEPIDEPSQSPSSLPAAALAGGTPQQNDPTLMADACHAA